MTAADVKEDSGRPLIVTDSVLMDDDKKTETVKSSSMPRPTKPQASANGIFDRFGRLFFNHAWPLVHKGYLPGNGIEASDMLHLSKDDYSHNLANRLYKEWSAQPANDRKMWRALASVFGMRYFGIALLATTASSCKVASALVLGQFIRFLQTPDAPTMDGILLGAGLVACMFMFSFIESHFVFRSTHIGINARVSVLSMLYSHLLKLNFAALPSTGQTLNIISNDAQRLEDGGPFVLFVVLAPIETLVVFGITAHQDPLDMLKSMEMLKLYAWEQPFAKRVMEFRNEEMAKLRGWYIFKSINSAFFWSSGGLMALAGFFVWFFVMGEKLTSQLLFTSLLLFNSVRVNVSLNRIDEFLAIQARDADQLHTAAPTTTAHDAPVVSLQNASFAWDRDHPVLSNINLTLRRGDFLGLIGPVGSGKSSLQLALLGHLHLVSPPASAHVTTRLSYAPQSPFIFADGFGKVGCRIGYTDWRARRQGERRARARLALARAVYQDADLYVLDDIFSALDAAVANRIYDALSQYLSGRTVILVSHQLSLIRRCPSVAYLNHGGIVSMGTYAQVVQEATAKDPDFAAVLAEYANESGAHDATGWDEVAAVGGDKTVFTRFIKMSGATWLLVASVVLGLLTSAIQAVADYFLSRCVAFDSRVLQHILTASVSLFGKMLDNVMHASPRFFMTRTSGTILNRFSRDMALLDELLPDAWSEVIRLWLYILVIIVTVAIAVPYILLAVFPVVLIFFYLRARYVVANRQIRRLEALSRSPVYSHLVSSVEGMTTVTAMQRQELYFERFCACWMKNAILALLFSVERWLCMRVDMLACVVIIAATGLMVGLKTQLGIGLASLAQMYVLSLVDSTQYAVRKTAELELQFVSVERILEYAENIPLEASHESEPGKQPPTDWPSQGVIEFRNMSLTYEGSDRPALESISFKTLPGESIGLCGRTGSGKSSTINALFRMAEPTPRGSIIVDGIDICDIGLHDLRKSFAIIPQSVFIYAGSVRYNLDPLGAYSEQELWNALELVELKDVVGRLPRKLDDIPNFSAGQGQLLQLARVILRKAKVLVLDECSSNIDIATDRILQRTIREHFTDCTLLTIAHRCETIIGADRILMLDQGRILELGKPADLLRNPASAFRALAEQSLGKDKLADHMSTLE
ncbi:P-loop containing nucleoside triphosphate hydrolase protein [Catenaria anguillulae PL171]|uniref:p-loop containing nucleoside triphosphate hydrolase protein n=1 Tax=Catenaria anguillulae PL171 TaxID=765915 RepID=A0A1Y2I3C0_9FUNG|nr:P-loop containing nucleoside triphosphate hydrolase protein [Catenaria anguillulae PL171]